MDIGLSARRSLGNLADMTFEFGESLKDFDKKQPSTMCAVFDLG